MGCLQTGKNVEGGRVKRERIERLGFHCCIRHSSDLVNHQSTTQVNPGKTY